MPLLSEYKDAVLAPAAASMYLVRGVFVFTRFILVTLCRETTDTCQLPPE